MFNYEYPPVGGGGGVFHAQIAEGLADSHQVCVVTSAFPELPRRESRDGVEIHRVPVLGRKRRNAASVASLLSYPAAVWRWWAQVGRKRPFDVVNCHFAVPTGPGSLPVAKLHGLPHVLSVHGGDLYDPSKTLSPHRLPVVRSVVAAVLRGSDAVVASSTNTRDNAHQFFRYDGPTEIIPLGVDFPATIPSSNRSSLGLPSGLTAAVTVGRLVARKGIDRLLRVLARPECGVLGLVVVGEGPEREALQELARELGIDSRVEFAGFVSEERKWEILASADLYASATLHEGFGLVYLEAMRAGLPVVTYDHGGHTDFLVDGETGYLVSDGDDDGLAHSLLWLSRHPHQARRIGRRNRELSRNFSIERCIEAYEALFRRIAPTVKERLVTSSNNSDSVQLHGTTEHQSPGHPEATNR